ncbi:hypothetical protein [Spirosoma knui]
MNSSVITNSATYDVCGEVAVENFKRTNTFQKTNATTILDSRATCEKR